MTVVSARPGAGLTTRIAVIAALSGVLFGYDASSINDALEFMASEFGLTALDKGMVVSILLLGAAVGSPFGGVFADRLGRKRSIVIAGCAFILFVLLTATAANVPLLMLGRFGIGLAIGITSAVTPLFIAEMAPSDRRGGLVALYQLAITLGILVAFAVGLALTPQHDWRLMIGLAVVPALVQVLAVLTVPESPRFLVTRGDHEGARRVLQSLRGRDAEQELADILAAQAESGQGAWADLFAPRNRPALAAGLGIALIQAFTGINAIMYYSTSIFAQAGFTGEGGAQTASLAVGLVNTGVTVGAIWLVNRLPRRTLLFWGLAGMVASLVAGAVGLLLPASPATSWMTVAAVLVFVASFAFSLGPIAWLVVAEVFPQAIRGRAASFATMGNWAANLVIALTFPVLVGAGPDAGKRVAVAFLIYAAVGVASAVFIQRQVPETRGRTLEQIERDLRVADPV